jgi:hypothetical protein
MKLSIPLILLLAAAGSPAFANEAEEPDVMFFQAVAPPRGGPHGDHLVFLGAEDGMELKTVKGAPYHAETVTEVSQVLADGNRINRKHSGAVYRDGEGRVRREQVFAGVGPIAPEKTPRTVFIHDPVANAGWVLEVDEKVARKLPGPGAFHGGKRRGGAGEHTRRHAARREGQEESLGTQQVEGVEATGTRVVRTIPAGAIGNDKPIEIVHERWYSPELQTVVMSRRSDPRFGETTYRLTGIQRGEPDRALFAVPDDYRVEEGMAGRRFLKRVREGDRPPHE